ncbi:GNAT family N-acetyltransferase [Kitasatospora sp. NPDC050543]|uniref:GNAT family N-acetyltransferase n=1 Tax=Kitasatospora sp. NPDC050543 TaxID=3364054 RepID=UPI00379E0A5B
MTYTIRAVRHEEWPRAKEIRLAALQDPAAAIAFLDTYEQAVARPDEFWQQRVAAAAEGKSVRQFIAQDADDAGGRWVGTLSVLVEPAGVAASFGGVPNAAQTHVVGVFVRPEARGSGIAEALFGAARQWSWELPEPRIERVRLYVHEDNARAQAFYRKAGFRRTGHSEPVPGDADRREIEMAIDRA